MTDSWLFRTEVCVIIGALLVIMLWRLMLALDERGFTASYRGPVAAGLALRLLAVAIAAAIPAIGHKLTSTDEVEFLATAKTLATLPLTSSKWLSMAVHWTEVVPWALTYKVFGNCGTLPLRLEQIWLSLAAVVIVSATAGKIGGRRAGLITAWIAAIEPSTAYFSGLLHQESLCMLGEALLLAGLVEAWMRDRPRWRTLLAMLIGIALIFGTRSYLAFFAGVASVLVLVGAALVRRIGLRLGLVVLTVAALLIGLAGIAAAPSVVPGSLANLQHQLDFRYPGANLPLPHASVTNAGGLLRTIVSRSVDLLIRPYPWQTHSAAQKVAVAGTLIWYVLMIVTLLLMLRQGIDGRLVPALILIACETVGFALTLVDAGEGFRHRINLVLILAVPLGVMIERWSIGRARTRYRPPARGIASRRGRAWSPRLIAPGGLVGLAIALGFALAMPARRVTTVDIPAPHRRGVPVYGALAPYAPRSLSVATVDTSPRIGRDALLGLLAGGLAAAALLTVGRERSFRGS
jgi:hypothetical protein